MRRGALLADMKSRRSVPVKKVKELIARRTASSSTWLNEDGSISVEKYLVPRFYDAGKGRWKAIDSGLSRVPGTEGSWRSGANSWRVEFSSASDPGGTIQITQPEASVNFTPRAVRRPDAAPSVTGAVATYPELWDGADLVQEVSATQVKETIILSKPSAPASFDFDMAGATPRIEQDGSISLVVGTKEVATIPAATVETADQGRKPERLNGANPRLQIIDQGIRVSVSEEWLRALPSSAFPVSIDPTYKPGGVPHPNAVRAYSSGGASSTTEVRLGTNAQGTWRTAVSVPLPAPPAPLNSQPWKLGAASMVVPCQSSCSLTSTQAWNEPSTPTSYSGIATGGEIPTSFDSTFDALYVFLGNSTWADGVSPWAGFGGSSGAFIQIPTSAVVYNYTYYELPPPSAITAPIDGSTIATTTPTLTTTAPSSNMCASELSTGLCDMPFNVFYNFKVTTAPEGQPGQTVAESGWINGPYSTNASGNFVIDPPTWKVPAGALTDGVTYFASVAVTNTLILYPSDENSGNILVTPPAGEQISFKVRLRLDAGGPSPTDAVGSVPGASPTKSNGTPSPGSAPASATVNMVTGNLAISLGTPQMRSISGDVGVKLSYNSVESSTSGSAATGGSSYGLRGQYYKDSGSHTYPSSSPVGTRIDPLIDLHGGYGAAPIGGLDPNTATPGKGYIVRWIGRISLPGVAAVPAGTTFKLGGATTGGMKVILNGATIYDNWSGTVAPTGTRRFGSTSLSPGTAGTIEVQYWEPNTAAETTAQFWVDEVIPANGTHSEYLIPSNWLLTTSTGLPPGWTFGGTSMPWTSVTDLGAQVVVHGSGDTLTFTRTSNGSYQSPPGSDSSLSLSDGRVQLSTATGYVFVFNQDGSLQSATSAEDDTNPSDLRYTYTPATAAPGSPVVLHTIEDPVSSREILLRYGGEASCPSGNNTPDGMLCVVEYWDGSSASFKYNSNQQLAAVVNPGNRTTSFAYTSANQLNALRDVTAADYVAANLAGSSGCTSGANASTCQFDMTVTYDADGRVATVTQPAPTDGSPRPMRTYTYQPSSTTPGAGTTLAAVAGFNPGGNAVIPAGYSFSQTYDAESRVVRQTASSGLQSHVVWNNDDLPIIEVSGDGLQTSKVYNTNDSVTDTYGPAPVGCFTAGSSNPWPANTSFATPPAPVKGYLPVANPEGTSGCSTSVPHTQAGYDEGILGLGVIYWPNGNFAGPASKHSTGNGAQGTPSTPCTGLATGTSDDSLCGTWQSGSAPVSTDAQGNWSMRLVGDLAIPTSGTYEFKGTSTQGLSLRIDGKTVGTNKVYSSTGALVAVNPQFTGQAALDTGRHLVQVEVQGSDAVQTAFSIGDRKVDVSSTFAPITLTRTDPNYRLPTSSVDADGKATATDYSATNGIAPHLRLPTTSTQGPGGSTPLVTKTTYESPGPNSFLRRTATTLPSGGQTTYAYWGDAEGLPASVCGVSVGTSQGGLLKSITGQAPTGTHPARKQYFVYDAAGRTAGEWVGPGDVSFSSIAASAWRCTTRDSRGRTVTQTWPAFGSAPSRTVTHSYAVYGNPLINSVTDTAAIGTSITTQVDLVGRLVTYVDASQQVTEVEYNRAGQTTARTGPQGAIEYTYDPDTGDLVTTSVNGQPMATAHYGASTGRLSTVDYSNGTMATVGYDTNGRQNSLVYTKQSDGSLVTGNQVTNSPAGRIISELQNINGSLTNPNPAGQGATDYVYDDAGRLSSAYLPGSLATYSYAANPASDGCEQPDAGANTNRTKVTIAPTGGASQSTQYCYNGADQLTKVTSGSQISLVGSAQAGQNLNFLQPNTPLTVSYPAGTTEGDQALLAVAVTKGTSITMPTGYTLVGTYQTNAVLGNNVTFQVMRRTLGAGETSVAVTFSKSDARTAVVAIYRGVDPDDPVDAFSGSTTNAGTTVTAPSVTTTAPGARVVAFAGQKGSSSATWTAPAGMTQLTVSSGGGTVTSVAADTTQANPGATGNQASVSSSSGALAMSLIALKPGATTSIATYDDHGNQITNGSTTYSFDASDRLLSTTVGGVVTTYTYDPVGRILKRATGTSATYYGYGGYSDAPIDTRTDAGVVQQIVSLPGGVTNTIQTAGAYHPVTAERVLNTSNGTGVPQGAVPDHGSISLQVTGVGGVPASNVTAVAINLGVSGPTGSGNLIAYPDGGTQPSVSNLHFDAGQVVGNLAIVPVGSNGKIRLYNSSTGTVQIIGDIQGYYQVGTAINEGAFQPLSASRMMDTRNGTGGVPADAVAASGTLSLQVAGVHGVPETSKVSAVVLNLMATGPTSAGSVTVYPDGTTRPQTVNLSYAPGQSVTNTVIVPLGANGKVAFYNGSTGTTDLVADIQGYYVSGPSDNNAGSYHPLTPSRVLNTQDGTGVSAGLLAGNTSFGLQINGTGGVPSQCVSAVAMNLTASTASASGELVAYPDGSTNPGTSNLRYQNGRTTTNLAIVPVGSNGKVRIANQSTASLHVAGDVVGYIECSSGAASDNLWSYSDLHGNITVTANNSGNRVGDIVNYDPWGAPLASPIGTDNAVVTKNFSSFGVAGKVTDPGSGITIMGARAYNASQGRFLSVDPHEGGCANAYVYGFGDPLTQLDLTGYRSCQTDLIITGAALFTAALAVAGGIAAVAVGAEGMGAVAGVIATAAGAALLVNDIYACAKGDDKACAAAAMTAAELAATASGVGAPAVGARSFTSKGTGLATAISGLVWTVATSAGGLADCARDGFIESTLNAAMGHIFGPRW